MTAKKIVSVILIYLFTVAAWMILGSTNQIRSSQTYSRLGEGSSDESGRASVQDLWGQPQSQVAPSVMTSHSVKSFGRDAKGRRVTFESEVTDRVLLGSSRVDAKITYEPRRKGLLWYRTYKVRFAGDYTFKNSFDNKRKFKVTFQFPAQQAVYDNVSLLVNGKVVEPTGESQVPAMVMLEPGQKATVHMSYGTQGMDSWLYKFAGDGSIANVKDFEARIHTNCSEFDFPIGSVSPTHKAEADGGWDLTWKYASLVSSFNIGVSLPQKLNPGPFAAKLSFFAPVSLFFFFAVLLILGAVRRVRLHPVHYMFLAAAFFSFHLLFSYMVDHVTPFLSFLVSSAVSLLLVITYLRLAVSWRFAVFSAGVWQFVFLVLFTYAFFFEGYTGLTITIGAILTLAVLMQMTGRVNWDDLSNGKVAARPVAPEPVTSQRIEPPVR